MKKRMLMVFLTIGMLAVGCGNEEVRVAKVITTTEDAEEAENSETEVKNQENEVAETLSFADLENLEFYFASGAGGWRTVMQIDADGRFSGEYSDSDMGCTGEGYPNGTYHFCAFDGQFTEPVKVNDYTYSVQIKEISYAKEMGTEEIIDGTLYCYSNAYGLDDAEEILLYRSGAPVSELPEEYRNWVRNDMSDPDTAELPFYGLYNVTEQTGFSSYDISGRIDDMMDATKEWDLTVRASLEHDDLNQAEMNIKAQELYEIWDAALNTLWTELNDEFSEDEFAKLLEEQRAWIGEKERAVEEAGKEYEGGSIYGLIVYTKAADITEKRVYELYELLK